MLIISFSSSAKEIKALQEQVDAAKLERDDAKAQLTALREKLAALKR